MKRIFLALLLFLTLLSCRSSLMGTYRDSGFGRYYIKLEKDSNYRYCYSYDTYHSFSYGTWKLKKDTISFMPAILYDTIRLKYKDSLVISIDEKADLILQKDKVTYNSFLNSVYMSKDMIMHPQRIIKSTTIKFFLKNKSLYRMDNTKQFIMIKQ